MEESASNLIQAERERPLISVLMSVLNCEKTLDESLNCLLAQTETRWELMICDDGSSDQTGTLIEKWRRRFPEKVTVLKNDRNRGLSCSLNRCLEAANGEFIARMDGDDLCSPERFAAELAYLRAHPDKVIVSTDMQCFDAEGVWGLRAYPTEPGPRDHVHGTPYCHAACMARTEAVRAAGGYSEAEDCERVEDYELWVRMASMGFRGGNIHEPLYQMRDDRNAADRRKWKYRVNEARVRLLAVRLLHLPAWMSVYALRPLIFGMLPGGVRSFLHHMRLKRSRQ